MQNVPHPKNLMSVVGTGIDKKFDYGGSDDDEVETIKDIVRNMEKFEISYGYQTNSILSFDDNRRYGNNDMDFDEPTQYKDIDKDSVYATTTQNHDVDKDIKVKYNNNTNSKNSNNGKNSKNNTNKLTNENIDNNIENNSNDKDNIDIIDTLEHFNGSQIVDNELKVIMIRSLCIALLFVLVSQKYFDKYLENINANYVSMIVLKSIIFTILFYLVEKFLLK
jgi:hypothetical protein